MHVISKKHFFLIGIIFVCFGLIFSAIFARSLEGLEWKVSTGEYYEFVTQDRYLGEQHLLYEEISFSTHTDNGYIFDDVYAQVYETPYESENWEDIGKLRINSQNRTQPKFNLEKIIPMNISGAMMKYRLDQTFSIMFPTGQFASQIEGWNYTATITTSETNIAINVIYNENGVMALWQVKNGSIIEMQTYLKGSPYEPNNTIEGYDPIVIIVGFLTVTFVQTIAITIKKSAKKLSKRNIIK